MARRRRRKSTKLGRCARKCKGRRRFKSCVRKCARKRRRRR